MQKKLKFTIKGTHCPSCKKLLEKRISRMNGVTSVDVDYETGETNISTLQDIEKEEISKVLEGMEYKVI